MMIRQWPKMGVRDAAGVGVADGVPVGSVTVGLGVGTVGKTVGVQVGGNWRMMTVAITAGCSAWGVFAIPGKSVQAPSCKATKPTPPTRMIRTIMSRKIIRVAWQAIRPDKPPLLVDCEGFEAVKVGVTLDGLFKGVVFLAS